MYAVIFKAELNHIDTTYTETASRMRELALNQYGCEEFTTATEANQEITISYWKNLEQIQKWKQDAEHLVAQESGKTNWYKSYQVEVVEILRSYSNNQ